MCAVRREEVSPVWIRFYRCGQPHFFVQKFCFLIYDMLARTRGKGELSQCGQGGRSGGGQFYVGIFCGLPLSSFSAG